MKERSILHIDINHCFAQIEEMKHPELVNVPMCVGGDESRRHGIVLARNLEAKKYGIKTTQTLREAYAKCPDLVVIPPSYHDYSYYSEKIKDVYREYTADVESFGIDEAWVDVTDSRLLFGSGEKIGREIQNRIVEEFGITVSVGVSFNKIFAKLGSDIIKPKGFVCITKDNYKEVVWPLPVEDLLYVGPKTKPKLNLLGIYTIGDLATFDLDILEKKFGKHGVMIWGFANGLDNQDVNNITPMPKSVGNGITTVRNMNTMGEVKEVMYVLAESIAARLKDQSLAGNVIAVSLRDTNLETISRQKKISMATNLVSDIMEVGMYLLNNEFEFTPPYRSISVTVSGVKLEQDFYQTNLFEEANYKNEEKRLDNTIEHIRGKYGFGIIKRALMLVNEDLTDFNPKGDHTIHPRGYFK